MPGGKMPEGSDIAEEEWIAPVVPHPVTDVEVEAELEPIDDELTDDPEIPEAEETEPI